ncbi:hypothetical protein [Paenibacillus kobensis]|uniref:hypothetical protein n=1 Tax=Paenibacillus kobensis TaxID=59841 RepID=UPI000FD92667|nr:hypothetical protein [Paenibacillus kobensis]
MNWENINKFLEMYTQHKHYHILFDKYKIKKMASGKAMAKILYDAVNDKGVLFSSISQEAFYDWYIHHQIDGNNYTFVYNLKDKPQAELLKEIYDNRHDLINLDLRDINPENESENLDAVMSNLTDINLVGIHKDQVNNKYTFSFVAPCVVNGKRIDGSARQFKKIFFTHCVVSSESYDCKIIFNPTANLEHVNGTVKVKRSDWSSIAEMFFLTLKSYIGDIKITAPSWIPKALSRFVEEATHHNNPVITEHSFNLQDKIVNFASDLLVEAGLDPIKDNAMQMKLVQDIQVSFEAQLVEKYGVVQEDSENFEIYRQRSDGLNHTIDVESRDYSLFGSAAQVAKRSRGDGHIDLLGINFRRDDRPYKFLVEQSLDAYLIRGTNTFIEEEVVDIVIRRLNQYRDEIQTTEFRIDECNERTTLASS